MKYAWVRQTVRKKFIRKSVKRRNHLEERGLDWRITLRCNLRKLSFMNLT
jgi:hypothetical protein